MRLAGKVVVITGSCTGIGRAIAQRCVAEGAQVIVHGLDEALGKELVQHLGMDRAALLIQDITQPDAPHRLVELARQTFGKLDAIVNNAALIAPSNIRTTDSDVLHQMLAVNTVAPLALIQAALPDLIQSQGCVLNIGSVNAWSGEPNLLAYSISKGGLMTLTRNLGDSLFRETGVRVNQINPGWVLTEKERQLKQDEGQAADWYSHLSPLVAPARRLLVPEEVASAAIYWLSDESGPVSGQVMELEQYPLMGRNLAKNEVTAFAGGCP